MIFLSITRKLNSTDKSWDDKDASNRAINDIEDYLLDELRKETGIAIAYDDIDDIIKKTFNIAKHRVKA
jgi:type I restriction enzyme R subunit